MVKADEDRPFRQEIYEEPQDASDEAGGNVSCLSTHECGSCAGISATFGKPELEEMLKQMTFTRSEATMEKLPEELLLNIFIRLLAKQLAQMRSVNKSWNALLTQSSFVKSHLHLSIRNNDQILLLFHDKRDSKPFTAKPTRSPCLELTNFIKLPVNPKSKYKNAIEIIGSVNGLICSSYDNDSVIHIWNPSLSAVLTLPPSSMPYHADSEIQFRFGYDPKTDDYKVVKLTNLTGPNINKAEWWLQSEIYSMRKGSWELITERCPSHIPYIMNWDKGCVDGHDGHLHWLGWNKFSERSIVAFDLGSQTFREIPLPDSIVAYNSCSIMFGILAGKLCVMSYPIGNDVYDMWVMEEYGVAESWVKRHVFTHFSCYIFVFGFTSHNELLIEDQGNLLLYNPSANKQKVLEDYRPRLGVDKVVEYVDSLVWVAPDDHEMVDCTHVS